jgi:broad specificity phosphatase PhoE
MASDRGRLSDPYERLAELAEFELGLVQDGRWDELAKLAAEREALIEGLPQVPPAPALQSLERAARLQQRVSAELARSIAIAREGLKRLDAGRRAAQGYAPAATPRPRLVDRAG